MCIEDLSGDSNKWNVVGVIIPDDTLLAIVKYDNGKQARITGLWASKLKRLSCGDGVDDSVSEK